jgi:hypothetical protein
MVRRLALAAVGGLLAFAAPAQAGISPGAALKVLNQWKRQAHEPTVPAMDPAESTGCAHHNHYMKLNGGQLTHYEESGKPGYTNDGAAAGAHSVLAIPEGTPRIWEGSVYHRIGILQPRLTKSGWAASEGFTCMQTQDLRTGTAGAPVRAYPWPPNGGTGFPTKFTDYESPDPHDIVPGELGYLLSVNLDGPWWGNYVETVTVNNASLRTASGTPVTVTKVDDTTPNGAPGGGPVGGYMNQAFAIFPHGALQQRTTYIAHADGKLSQDGTDYPFSVTWSFRTGPLLPGKASLALSKGHRDGKKVKFRLTASQSLVGRKATKTVNGGHAVQFKLVRSQTIRTRRPQKGKTVHVVVTTPAFVRGDYSYPAARASRKFTRKP